MNRDTPKLRFGTAFAPNRHDWHVLARFMLVGAHKALKPLLGERWLAVF
jgi:hypothetical protein